MTAPPPGTPPDRGRGPGLLRLGSVAGIAVTVSSSWFIVVAIIAVVMAPVMTQVSPGLGGLAYVAGGGFAVLLYLSTLLHELAHAMAARGFGMNVLTINLNFFGGSTSIEDRGNTPVREFVVAVVGPLTSLAVAGVGWLVYLTLDRGLVGFTLAALAVSNLLVGVLNLVPGLPLDGGRVLLAGVWAASGNRRLATVVAGWGGRIAAVAILGYPFVLGRFGVARQLSDFFFAAIIAAFLWAGASESLRASALRDRLPAITAAGLARPAISVGQDLSIAEGVRRADEASAGGLIVVDALGNPVAVVNEQAVRSTPTDRRPWVTCGEVARRLDPGLVVAMTAGGEQLISQLQRMPATEYIVVNADNQVYGVLAATDVARALRAR
jgi:Zn-dependent protease/CBS domain-containing protein